MFEKEIKFIYDFNLNKLNKFGSFFSFQQLSESDIHPAIIQYISAEMDYLIFEDRQKLVKDSIFDYSGEKVAGYFSLINEELKRNKRLSSDYAAKIMLHSISFNVNFLVRPKWALAKFIFEDESHRTAAEIKQILNYTYFYKYLRKIIASYLNEKKVISMNSAEFAELLNKIDEATIQSNYQGMLSASLKSMAEFFCIGGVQRSKIPFNAVQMFLDDKGLDAPLAKLREEYSDDPNNRLEVNDVYNLLTSVLLKKVEIEAEPEPETELVEEELSHFKAFDREEEEEKQEHFPMPEVFRDDDEDKPLFAEKEEIAEEPEETEIPEERFEEEEHTIPVKRVEETDEEEREEEGEPEEEPGQEERISIFKELMNLKQKERSTTEMIDEMESLIEEEKDAETGLEIEQGTDDKDYDDWVFVEEKEHDDLIKEIADTPEQEVKKQKHTKKKSIHGEDEEEPSLFNEKQSVSFGEMLEEEAGLLENSNLPSKKYDEAHNDFSKLLEHREMGHIIETVFDSDIEEVELMLNSISFFSTYEEIERFINTYFVKMGIKPDSNEAVAFKRIIKENYTR